MLTLGTVLALGIGSYLLRLLGLTLVTRDRIPAWAREPLELLPAAVLASLTVTLVVTPGGGILDARLLGVAVAAILVWRRASLVTTMLAAAAVTALIRLVAG